MRKLILLLCVLTLSFVSGCDIADFEIELTETESFPVIGATGLYGVNVDISDNNDFDEYEGYLKDIEIVRFDYRVAQNLGNSGSTTLYISPLDPAVTDLTTITVLPADAVEITGPITFDHGITTIDWVNVTLLNKKYFENMFLKQKKFTLWADTTTTGVAAVEIVARFKIKITASLFEKL